jgi:hypothetical protein
MPEGTSDVLLCNQCQQSIESETDLVILEFWKHFKHFHRRCHGEWSLENRSLMNSGRRRILSNSELVKSLKRVRILSLILNFGLLFIAVLLGGLSYPPGMLYYSAFIIISVAILSYAHIKRFQRTQTEIDLLNRVFPDS